MEKKYYNRIKWPNRFLLCSHFGCGEDNCVTKYTHTHYWINSNRNTTCLKYWCQEINWYLIHDDIIDQYLCLCLCVYWIIISRFSCVCAIYKWKRDEKQKIFDRHQINVHTNISTSWAKKNKVYLVCIWWALDVNFRGICHI